MSLDRWVTLDSAALVTQRSKRTLHRIIRDAGVDTNMEDGKTIVYLPALMLAVKQVKRGGARQKTGI